MKFKLNCIDWEVFIVSPTDPHLTLNDSVCYGVTDLRKQEIYLDGSLKEVVFKQTAIHELLHAFKWSYGAYFPTAGNDDIDEVISDFVGAHLCSIYGLTKRIMKEYHGGADDA